MKQFHPGIPCTRFKTTDIEIGILCPTARLHVSRHVTVKGYHPHMDSERQSVGKTSSVDLGRIFVYPARLTYPKKLPWDFQKDSPVDFRKISIWSSDVDLASFPKGSIKGFHCVEARSGLGTLQFFWVVLAGLWLPEGCMKRFQALRPWDIHFPRHHGFLASEYEEMSQSQCKMSGHFESGREMDIPSSQRSNHPLTHPCEAFQR